jgi:prolyl-tRNA synthetase
MQSQRGFIRAFWCESRDCESKIKQETKASTRCLPFDSVEESGKCIYCGKPAKYRWLFAQSY